MKNKYDPEKPTFIRRPFKFSASTKYPPNPNKIFVKYNTKYSLGDCKIKFIAILNTSLLILFKLSFSL